jgi:hypothetical protein
LASGNTDALYQLIVQTDPKLFLRAARDSIWKVNGRPTPILLNGNPSAASLAAANDLVNSYRPLAEDVLSILTAKSQSAGLRLEGVKDYLKTPESLARKIDKGRVTPDKINDIARFTIIVDREKYYQQAADMSRSLLDEGYELTKIKDTWAEAGVPYKGVNLTFRDTDGLLFEVQIHTNESFAIKSANHDLYGDARLPGAPAPVVRLGDDVQIALSAQLAQPLDLPNPLNSLKSPTTGAAP